MPVRVRGGEKDIFEPRIQAPEPHFSKLARFLERKECQKGLEVQKRGDFESFMWVIKRDVVWQLQEIDVLFISGGGLGRFCVTDLGLQ